MAIIALAEEDRPGIIMMVLLWLGLRKSVLPVPFATRTHRHCSRTEESVKSPTLGDCDHLVVDKSPGRQAKPQSLAVWWLLKQITAPGPRPRSSTNDLAPPRRMGWVSRRPYLTRLVGERERAALGNRGSATADARGRVGPRISLPPEAEALKKSSHVWAGFWLRGVQP